MIQSINFRTALLVLCILVLSAAALRAQNAEGFPALSGKKAIDFLKQNGQFDLLADAVDAAKTRDVLLPRISPEVSVVTQKVTDPDATNGDRFGEHVVISGTVAVISAHGADNFRGAVYIFRNNGSSWVQEARLTASDGVAMDNFGFSIAISGAEVIVGAPYADVNGNFDQGAAYIFSRPGTVWLQQAKLTASDGESADQFGFSVSLGGGNTGPLGGDTAIVGAWRDKVGSNIMQGSAYVFTGSGTSWPQQAKLTASDGAPGDNLGFSVSISSETVIAGATHGDISGTGNQGAAYVFTRSSSVWTQQAKLTASDGAAQDAFGVCVSISIERAVVGAYRDDVGSNADQGSAYVFTRSGTTWTEQQKLTDAAGAAGDEFGQSVQVLDDIMAGSAYDDSGSNISNEGSASVFTFSGGSWTQEPKYTASDGDVNDYFGSGVTTYGGSKAAGAPGDNVGGGSVYFFTRYYSPYVTLSGRVLTANGTPIRNAQVILFGTFGSTQVIYTGSFGNYQFHNVETGEMYQLSASAKRFRFANSTMMIFTTENLTGLDFIANP